MEEGTELRWNKIHLHPLVNLFQAAVKTSFNKIPKKRKHT